MPRFSGNRTEPNIAERLSSAVYHDLRMQILSGEYTPGQWISVEDLCKAMDVSRQPVMEAIRRLSNDWLIEVVPQVGCRVASYDKQSMMDYINRFGAMEGYVAAFAAERRTAEQMEQLETLTQEILQRDEMDAENIFLGGEYHRLILEMAHSAMLERLCEQLWTFGAFVFNTMVTHQTQERLLRQRKETLKALSDAIGRQDKGDARRQMEIWLTDLGGWFGSPQAAADGR